MKEGKGMQKVEARVPATSAKWMYLLGNARTHQSTAEHSSAQQSTQDNMPK